MSPWFLPVPALSFALAAAGRHYPAGGPILACLLVPSRGNREAMFSAAWPGNKSNCVSTTQAHLRARTA
jgi:hypothetical protein